MKQVFAIALVAAFSVGIVGLSGCGGGSDTANECDLCTLAEHTGQVADHCATGHGADGHRLECASCRSHCTAEAASLRCGNSTDTSVCADGIY